jgi:hypothetical protein
VLADSAAWEFARAEEMIQIAESMYGPYLWDRYDILVLPKGFPWGGMENPRLTFLTPSTLAGTRDFDGTVMHELGHAWTGNLVTNATWEDFWLNEGWTTYIQIRLREAIDGTELASFERRWSTDLLSAEIRRLKKHPEQTALKFPMEGVDPDEALSLVPYEKGAQFLFAIEQAVGRKRFDSFTRAYIRRFSFRPITTDMFLRFLTSRLPGIGRRVPLRTWIYHRGLPPSPPRVTSHLYRQVRTIQNRFKAGVLPTRPDVSGWDWRQTSMFLDTLPDQVSLNECLAIEEAFALKESKNYAVLGYYYPHAIRAGNKGALPRIRSYLLKVGGLYFLRLVYTALSATAWSREEALQLYTENRPTYHPITQGIVDKILNEAGLRVASEV